VNWLLAHGVDPNRISGWESSLISEAKNAVMVKILLDAGANPDVEGMFGTALSTAPDAESVRLMVQHGANLRPKLKVKATLLESVVNRGLYDKADVVDELIKQGAEFDPKGNGANALANAAYRNQVRTMQVLMDHGVSPNACPGDKYMQRSVLGNAAGAHAPDAIKLLLDRGANPEGDPRDTNSPLSAAIIFGQTENIDLLRKAGARDVGDLSYAAALGDAAKVTDFLAKGTNVNETDKAGNTPLYYAVRRGHPEIAQLLIEHGANVNLFDSWGMTPQGCFETLQARVNPQKSQMDWGIAEDERRRRRDAFQKLFTKYPVNPNYQDRRGRTALHQAVLAGDSNIFPTGTKDHPANLNLLDHDGNTPLLLAVLSPLASDTETRITTYENYKTPQQKEKPWNTTAFLANLLIKAGAKLDLRMPNGFTQGEVAMLAAVKAKNPQLIAVLRDAGVTYGTPAPHSDSDPSKAVTAQTPAFQNITISGKVRFTVPEMVDLEKSTGYLVSASSADNQNHEFHFSPDGAFTLPNVKPGIYERHLHLVQKNQGTTVPLTDDMPLSPFMVDGTSERMTMNLNCSVRFGGVVQDTIQIELKLVEIPEEVYRTNKTKLDAALAKENVSVLNLLNNLEGVSFLAAPSVITHPGQKATIDIVREFSYPTSFEKAKIQNVSLTGPRGVTNAVGYIPPTPRDFVTKDVGVSATITPTFDQGKILLNGKFSVTSFAGFVASDLGAQMPSFNISESMFLEALDDRQLKGLWIPGLHVDDQASVADAQGKRGTPHPSNKSGKMRYLIFLTANLVK